MILVFGTLYDEMAELMCARLKQMKYDYIHVDPENLQTYDFTWKTLLGKKPEPVTELILETGKEKIHLNDLTGIYCRFANVKRRKNIKGMSKKETSCIYNESLSCWIKFMDRFQGKVVNRLSNSLSNESKIYQQIRILKSGFLTPKTLVTNDPEKIQDFYESCNRKIIFKSISNLRSIVTKFSSKHFSALNLVKNCPVQFQEMIEGLDIRVHAVGDKVLSTAIKSDAVDYRYAGKYKKSAEFSAFALPKNIATACVGLSKSFGLEVTGIDLKRTNDGKYYCFEVNPSPAFISFERMTGQPISTEVAKLLRGKL